MEAIKAKRVIELTDIQMHARTFRPTGKKLGVEKTTNTSGGRLFSNGKPKIEKISFNSFKMFIPLTEVVAKQIRDGEVEITIPKNGILLNFSPDAIEKMKSLQRKDSRRIFRNTRVWRKR